ncbi:hypothetical protein DRQ50_09620 [bacterium]|nr:MAG: hypothetical protein DRQ50_09620 [bacterium]
MKNHVIRHISLALLMITIAACSGDDLPQQPPGDSGLLSGDVDPAGAGFTIELGTAGTPDRPLQGPFVLRGRNLRYVPGQGALAVDLTMTNAGEFAHPEPVGLTFMELFPDSVRVLDPDNGITGPGAAIVFGFENDDAMWTPGETSIPRTVHFTAAPGQAVAFLARVDIGTGPLTGSIAGRVWNDLDGDGIQGPGEPGLAGVPVFMEGSHPVERGGDDLPPFPGPPLAWTDNGGFYRFAGLPADFYTVQAMPEGGAIPTTAGPLHIVLSELEGQVSTYDEAHFGFQVTDPPVMEIMADADASVRADQEARTNDNYGCAPYLAVGTGRDGTRDLIRTLVHFELPPVTDIPPVGRFLLTMQIDRFRDSTGEPYELGVHAVVPSGERTPWQEGNGSDLVDGSSCVWVDEADGVAWFGAGDGGDANNQSQPDFDPEPVATAFVSPLSMGPSAMIMWDVTGLVHDWVEGRQPNLGLVIRDLHEPPDGAGEFKSLWLVSREAEGYGRRGPRLVFESYIYPTGEDD